MRRMNLTQLLKNTAAFTTVSTATIDAGLLLADRTGLLNVPGGWYLTAPLLVWTIAGIPLSITLAERLVAQVNPNPGKITAFAEGERSPLLHRIPFTAHGKQGTLLAHTVPSALGYQWSQTAPPVSRPARWHVPIDGHPVTVRESELRQFLDVAAKRSKYQFSRRYWLKTRRPPLYRAKYDAYMRLLVESGLVEGRHAAGGASGRLVTKPHHAITYLKFESPYAVVR